MPEKNNNFHNQPCYGFKDTVCIDCNKIMDSCRDKDYQYLVFNSIFICFQ